MMGRETGKPPLSAGASWRRIARALVNAPVSIAAVLTITVLLLAGMSEPDLGAVAARTGNAALVFAGALLGFSFTFGVIGVALLLAIGQRGPVAWAWAGAILGVIAAMGHGLASRGVVDGSEMTSAGLLAALMFLMIRHFAGIRDDQRPS